MLFIGHMPRQTLTEDIIELIQSIPIGRVSTYGQIAQMAGNPRAARQVARILHTCSENENLPWWRVVDRTGGIALKSGCGREEQIALLLGEGIAVDDAVGIDLKHFKWDGLSRI